MNCKKIVHFKVEQLQSVALNSDEKSGGKKGTIVKWTEMSFNRKLSVPGSRR